MRKTYLAALLAACFLSACGGGGNSSPEPTPDTTPLSGTTPPPSFARQISFGDSLSDVGTYAVATVKNLGGGKFTINGDSTTLNPALTGLNWVDQLAKQLNLSAPCAAQTGLDGDATLGFSVPVVDHAGCHAYAQGGARVTNPVGPTHKLTGSPLGALTVPVATQISRHLALSGGKFKSSDLVLVMAGGNDLLFELGMLRVAAEAAGTLAGQRAFEDNLVAALTAGTADPATVAAAVRQSMASERAKPGSSDSLVAMSGILTASLVSANPGLMDPAVYAPILERAFAGAPAAGQAAAATYVLGEVPRLVGSMVTAGTELSALVKEQILAHGAQHVVVNNLPDVALTPTGRAMDEATRSLITAMVQAFNEQLRTALAGEARVLLVDAYALTQDAAANPTTYGLTNVTDTACDLSAAKNALQNSITCNASNLKAGDVSHYAYADGEHPTPYFYNVLTNRVTQEMKKKGWL